MKPTEGRYTDVPVFLNEVSDASARETAALPNQSMCVHFKQQVCVCECEKMFTMQLNRESFVDEVQSAPVFLGGEFLIRNI